jgi:hypothetical protein
MDELQWLSRHDPHAMLNFIASRTSPRKLLLFACACARRILFASGDEQRQEIIALVERFADDPGCAAEWPARPERQYDLDKHSVAELFLLAPVLRPPLLAAQVAINVRIQKSAGHPRPKYIRHRERRHQCQFLREIFGNPFRPVTWDWSLLGLHQQRVRNMAQVIYDENRFDELPFRGDALEEAGCVDAQMLGHCRNRIPHVRGCWVLDLLVEKQ